MPSLPTHSKTVKLQFGDSWMFKIKKGRKKKYVEKGITYPRVIESEGENPEQYSNWEDE